MIYSGHKQIKFRMCLAVIFLTISTVCLAQFGGGQGTADSPYQIATAAHLNAIRGQFLGDDIHFVQTANIDLDEAPWNEGEGWNPIGEDAARFQGTFDGGEFAINGLMINRNQEYQGLFGFTAGADLVNITLTNAEIRNSGSNSGTLAGRAWGTRIDNCVVSGSLTSAAATQGVGGMLGYYSGQMTYCAAHVDVTANNANRVGGLIGDSWGAVRDSYATGNVRGNNRVGGLCGNDYNSVHERILATGDVLGNDEVGGLYGFVQTATYNDCYAVGNVTGNTQVGGLIGNYNLPANNNQQVHRGYSMGVVTGNEQVGGMVGRLRPNIPGPFYSYWNTETSEQDESAAGEGLTIVEMLDSENFETWNFGAEGPWRIDPGSFPYLAMEGDQAGEHNFPTEYLPPGNFRYVIGDDRDEIRLLWNEPTLIEPIGYNVYRNGERLNDEMLEQEQFLDTEVEQWTLYLYGVTALYEVEEEIEESNPAQLRAIITDFDDGDGTEDNPYTVSDALQLHQIRNLLNSHFIQTENIDLSEREWVPIGTRDEPFTGRYNGDEFIISGLTVEAEQSYQGLFGVAAGASLINITLEDADVSGDDYVGALAGRATNATIVETCSAYGTVSGNSQVGGLIGYFEGRLLGSYTLTRVEGSGNYVGGLVGDCWGMIERSYAAGNVSGVNLVGGLAGSISSVGVNACFALGSVTGLDEVGGLAGRVTQSRLINSYATGSVTGRSAIGGLLGTNASRIHFTYSIGLVQGQENVGGLIGREEGGAMAERSYWNTRSSGQEESAGGEARDDRHMTHPYSEDTFVDWDFERVWGADEENRNRGYPYLLWQPFIRLPYPDVAENPQPAHRANEVSTELDELSWRYTQSDSYTNPAGFRVYFNTTGEFGEDDDFEWIAFEEDQENYRCADILPEELEHLTTYYWKVVPSTVSPDNGRAGRSGRYSSPRKTAMSRNDAQDVPVWRFTTEVYPNPLSAVNPQPEHQAEDIPVTLESLGWTYNPDPEHADPRGFRVYLNTTGEFGEDEDYEWVPFTENQSNYTNSSILPEKLDYAEKYYWRIVPTTNEPDGRRDPRALRNRAQMRNEASVNRGDAENVPVWSFSTLVKEPYPLPATNPDPEHLASGVSLELDYVSWDYAASDIYTDPAGFRIYMNTTGAFGQAAPYEWVDYVEGQERYKSTEIIPEILDEETTYYWRVIPTTNHPEDKQGRSASNSDRESAACRGDAPDSPIWRFTTGTTDVQDETDIPLVTKLGSNYPNPFNPETTISFSIAEAAEVSLKIYNTRGQWVATLVDEYLEPGRYRAVWNSSDNSGRELSSGVYFYTLQTEKLVETGKMLLLR